jgi:hypothetical protein
MTLPQFWTMIFGKRERARGRDKLAQRWVQRLRFSDTHLGLANLAQLLISRETGNLGTGTHMDGLRVNQASGAYADQESSVVES